MPQLPSPTEFMRSRAPQPPPARPGSAPPSPTEFMRTRAPQPPEGAEGEGYSLGGFAGNLASSTGNLLSGVGSMLVRPLDTVEGLTQMGLGAVAKVTGPESYAGRELETRREDIGRAQTNPVDDLITNLKERYGGWEAVKKTAYNDPAGLFADIAGIMSGAGGAMRTSRLAGLARAGKTLSAASRYVDPLNVTMKTVSSVGGPIMRGAGKLASEAVGITTGAGGEAVRTAFHSPSGAFLAQLRDPDISEIADNATKAIQEVRRQRGAEYRANLAQLPTVNLDASSVVQRLSDELDNFGVQLVPHPKRGGGFVIVPHFEGPLNKIADAGAQQEVRKLVRQVLDQPNKSGTPLTAIPSDHLDALKQRLDSLYHNTSEARRITASVRGSVRDVLHQVPGYDEMTGAYERATDFLKQGESELSLKDTAAKGTTIGKLINALNSPRSQYRQLLVDMLDTRTGSELRDQLAGYALSQWAPRGLMRTVAGATILWGLAKTLHPSGLLELALTSPRAIGELTSALGEARAAGPQIGKVGRALATPGVYRSAQYAQPERGSNTGRIAAEVPPPAPPPGVEGSPDAEAAAKMMEVLGGAHVGSLLTGEKVRFGAEVARDILARLMGVSR